MPKLVEINIRSKGKMKTIIGQLPLLAPKKILRGQVVLLEYGNEEVWAFGVITNPAVKPDNTSKTKDVSPVKLVVPMFDRGGLSPLALIVRENYTQMGIKESKL